MNEIAKIRIPGSGFTPIHDRSEMHHKSDRSENSTVRPNMKITRILLASIGILIILTTSSVAEVQSPTFRETADWIIVSGWRNHDKANLPWSFAIKKSSVKSVTISTGGITVQDLEVYKTKRYDSPETQKLPAIITITTDGLMSGGANITYQIDGLTQGSAPAMLEKILGATSNPGGTK